MIILISCGARKRDGIHLAKNLYIGPYFKAAYSWAATIVPDEQIFVLSALYGLVPVGTPIASYDLTLGESGCVSSSRLREQAQHLGVEHENVVVVGGVRYVELARSVWPNAVAPFGKGGSFPKTGIGYQLQALKASRGQVPA